MNVSSYTQLNEKLWIGPQPNVDILKHLQVDEIISLRRSTESKLATLHYPLTYWEESFNGEDIKQLILLVNKLIIEGKKILVHCYSGIDRSGVFAILYLVNEGYTVEDAIEYYKKLRNLPLPGFGALDKLEVWSKKILS
ncbi:dual specificity protein phosphatase family protein [Acinetobacter sp. AOR15_HL]|uniref:protein-tyrosine phosphatase family protein n=1 Tax=unclassified Acinetobacter TaxID=196816 RepID=UPI0022EA6C26|nr:MULTISPECIES: dual specificity protein phosphatase [unclassified Acinetobacter]MDA3556161.1 dual specificity protein phosphatase family protein [Acinetobacter sp. AOR15_HL]MDA3571618.1 dual specificity protein phosphatase family protein [Acinetobacter sp. AOR14_HL]